MLCPNCGEEVAERKKFCGHCGQQLTPSVAAVSGFDDEAITRLDYEGGPPAEKGTKPESPARGPGDNSCLVCGRLNPSEARFCNGCGANLVEQKPTQEGPARREQPELLTVQPSAPTIPPGTTSHVETKNIKIQLIRLAWMIIIVGWGLGGYFADLYRQAYGGNFIRDGQTSWVGVIIVGLVGGLFLSLGLRLVVNKLRVFHFLLITVGWTVAGLLMRLPIGENHPYSLDQWILIGFLAGGLVTGLVLKRIEPGIRFCHLLVIALGWLIGSFPGIILALLTSVESNGYSFHDLAWSFNFISGALVGAVCGGITLLVISRVHRGGEIQTGQNT